ncbi:9259_t:CDS:2 [Rhizophagus irregularis]|nr:9259_t:CDS:2 [Rhizophagus irregularis]
MSVNSLSTSNPKEQEQKFLNDHETQVLYELHAIQLTSSGGRLYEAQQRSNTGLDDFKKLISK